ncbi:Na+/H+ antiporter subunit A [Streptomyces sp. DSM 44915]|uniref:Na+/H+ antiporter subunit A n=1 Tax=Streptomyces chisholmiae TaxID=3075540 RepID=A0ABU2JSP8_9ACTN|nr:Na+/H+ antiporter subunit A [Streptomyces sp. DSM 44915]MDT0267995.1 Na+/H+ antiporter subunit A [Streptomyces sp. DSM 44915]
MAPIARDGGGLTVLSLFVLHVLVASVLPWLAARSPRGVWYLAALVPLAAVGWAAWHTGAVLDGRPRTETLSWAPALNLVVELRLDPLSLLMVYVVSGVGALVLLYCAHYLPGRGREAGLLLLFAGVMFGLVTADQLIALYIFWELTSVISFLLIAGRGEGSDHRRAAEQALLTTAAGGLAMLFGFILLGAEAGTYRISELLADPPSGGLSWLAVLLILVGAFAKSAQIPFSAWLPAAMVAPTPVSAYLHAAAMVKAGVYLVARLAPALEGVAPWRPLVLTFGLVTMVVAAWRALRQHDLKLLIAYGTVSELGMLIALLGAGTRTSALAGEEMLLAHAAFKSALFLTVGVVEKTTGTRDLTRLSGLGRRLPLLAVAATVSAASMAGLPPLIGYLGKEAAYEGFWHAPFPGGGWAVVGLALGSLLTVAYSARFLWGAFARKPGVPAAEPAAPAPGLLLPIVLLSAAAPVLGLWYTGTAELVLPYAGSAGLLVEHGPAYTVKLWHGVTPPLLVSASMIVLGLVLHQVRRPVERVRARLPRLPDSQRGYDQTVRGVDRAAMWLTRHTQVGSLPFYLSVLLVTFVVVPVGTLLAHPMDWPRVVGWDSAVQLPLSLVTLVALGALVVARHRLTAVLLVGAVGYAVAGLFLVRGAPDLALTQFLVETLTVVVVVLVLRRLPSNFTPERPSARSRVLRAVIAVAAGASVAYYAISATAVRQSLDLSDTIIERAPETGAVNAVNALLVDFRALDTLGEISVLLVTVIGSGALLGYRSARRQWPTGPAEGSRAARAFRGVHWDVPREPWLPEAEELPSRDRSLLLEVVVRALFPAVLVLSVYLLFAGHYRPGGGFAGGLVAGQAFTLRYLVGRRAEAAFPLRITPRAVAGGGLALAALVALAPLAFGQPPLSSTTVELAVPLLGDVKIVTNLFFDLGVYLLVLGVCLKLLFALAQARNAGDTLVPYHERTRRVPR